MLKIKHVAVCMLALAMLSAGCTNYSGNTYSGSQVRSAQTVQYGTVVSVQPVTLEEDRPAVLGTVGGGVVGGVLTKQNGLEITVELENGQQLSIVQAADQQFSPGERVRVLRGSDGSARVTR